MMQETKRSRSMMAPMLHAILGVPPTRGTTVFTSKMPEGAGTFPTTKRTDQQGHRHRSKKAKRRAKVKGGR